MRNQINMKPVEIFLTEEYDIATVITKLDEIAFSYAQYAIRDKDLCGAPWIAEEVYMLRQLRDCLKEIDQ